jgi:hypothetical protein
MIWTRNQRQEAAHFKIRRPASARQGPSSGRAGRHWRRAIDEHVGRFVFAITAPTIHQPSSDPHFGTGATFGPSSNPACSPRIRIVGDAGEQPPHLNAADNSPSFSQGPRHGLGFTENIGKVSTGDRPEIRGIMTIEIGSI